MFFYCIKINVLLNIIDNEYLPLYLYILKTGKLNHWNLLLSYKHAEVNSSLIIYPPFIIYSRGILIIPVFNLFSFIIDFMNIWLTD